MVMKYRKILLVPLLVFAGFVVMGTGVTAAAPASASCTHAEDFGAVPDDGQDDRVQLQAAIDAAQASTGCLELGPGTFHATRKPTAGVASIPSLRISDSLVFRGAGQGVTTLAMLGPSVNTADWWLLNVAGATDVTVTGLTLDGSQRTNTGEQTHLLQLIGPTQHVVVDHVSFNLPVIGPSTGGDCIRLLGTATDWVRDTTIRDTLGVDCDRSFVGLQRGVDGLVIERSESVKVGDQAIDFEPTGGEAFNCQPVIKNVFMRALTLRRAATQGLAVTIHGAGCAVAQNVTLTDSIVEDGTVSILDAADVTLSRLHLRSLPGDSEAAVVARKRVVNLRILDSVIERPIEAGTGASIRVGNQSGAYPQDVLVSGVRVEQATPGPLVATGGLKRLVIVNTQLVYTGPPVNNFAVLVCGDATQPAEQPVLIDTTIQGALAGAVQMCGQFTGPPVLVRVTGP
jgi:hypothetical protein